MRRTTTIALDSLRLQELASQEHPSVWQSMLPSSTFCFESFGNNRQ